MEDELQGMEEAVPERVVDETPIAEEQPTTVFEAVVPEVEEVEEAPPKVEEPDFLDEELDEGDGRMKAVDLIGPPASTS